MIDQLDRHVETQVAPNQQSESAYPNQRREKRIELVCPIEVCGLDVAHEFFVQRTCTWDVSQRGCRFTLQEEVGTGAILAIRLLDRESGRPATEPILFQVEWVRPEGQGWLMGASCLQDRVIWNLGFPEAT